jgi:hypothetical protein
MVAVVARMVLPLGLDIALLSVWVRKSRSPKGGVKRNHEALWKAEDMGLEIL